MPKIVVVLIWRKRRKEEKKRKLDSIVFVKRVRMYL